MNRLFAWAWERALAGKPGVLTRVFWRWIPFNGPHRFRIQRLERGAAWVESPDRLRNRNHLRTQHACALATAGEFAAGLALLGAFSPTEYRLIMSRMEVDYTRRAQGRIVAHAGLEAADLATVEAELLAQGRTTYTVVSQLSDAGGEPVARVLTFWQIKSWSQIG